MNLNCGIVGLPNVGKSTIFSALSMSDAEIANFPFCTIKPNVAMVNVPDKRLDELFELIPSKKKINALIEFVDIAGLVKGASKGEGLGNQFLSNIREVGIICHVVRCFDDGDIVHVNGKVDPQSDIETVNTELCLKDLETLEKIYDKEKKLSRLKKTDSPLELYEKAIEVLSQNRLLRLYSFTDKEEKVLSSLQLLTLKKQIYVCNCDESGVVSGNKYTQVVEKIAKDENCEVLRISGKMEAEIQKIEEKSERDEFLSMMGLEESGLSTLIRKAFHTLDLCVFFTAGADEDRAWVFKRGMKAPECAGLIHSDFQKGFIKAEVYSFESLKQYKSEAEVRKHGLYRLEGKDYEMQDADIVFFKFNV